MRGTDDRAARRPRWLAAAAAAALLGLAAALPAAPAAVATAAEAVQAPRAGVIPFVRAEAHGAAGGVYRIAWSAPGAGEVRVYARPSPDADAPRRLVGHGGASAKIRVSGLPPAQRWWFELSPRRGAPLEVADRSLHLASAPNFRDLGGYRTSDGRWVRMGLAYRSDQLDRLNDADLAQVARLAPALVVDLRTAAERQKGPDRLPAGAEPLVADVAADAPPGSGLGKVSNPDAASDFLAAATRGFVTLHSARSAYGLLLTRVATTPGPAVYHCTAGKDRTGWASAVLLTLLGVPRETVMADYLASNDYLVEKNRALFAASPTMTAIAPVFWVKASYLEGAFEEVDRRYGSFDAYVREGLGLDAAAVARLRARFLVGEPAG
jgi:protein-tyrosine phosphatase